jgi:DNA-binding NarL/FixJ family response regulator
MTTKFPLRVALMDSDYGARKLNAALLMRDVRTTVITEAGKPHDLLRRLAKREKPEAIVVNVDHWSSELSVAHLIKTVKAMAPKAAVVCLSRSAGNGVAETAITAGASGFLLSDEIRLAIASGVAAACYQPIVVTLGLAKLLNNQLGSMGDGPTILQPWRPNPRLTRRQLEVFWLRVIYGMRASLAAQEIGLRPGTVERYLCAAYGVVEWDAWVDDRHLADVDLAPLSPEDRAFHWFTLPPR